MRTAAHSAKSALKRKREAALSERLPLTSCTYCTWSLRNFFHRCGMINNIIFACWLSRLAGPQLEGGGGGGALLPLLHVLYEYSDTTTQDRICRPMAQVDEGKEKKEEVTVFLPSFLPFSLLLSDSFGLPFLHTRLLLLQLPQRTLNRKYQRRRKPFLLHPKIQ